MGIKGLFSFIQNCAEDSLEWHKLQNCVLVIDGNNLAYDLYNSSNNLNKAYGGDYDKYAVTVIEFFKKLNICNVEAHVLMDGGHPIYKAKFNTVHERMTNQIEACNRVNPDNQSHLAVFPLLGLSVFINSAQKCGVKVIRCDFEADDDIIVTAQKLGAYVLSNDSDFYVSDVKVILLNTLNLNSIQKKTNKVTGEVSRFIPSYLFSHDKFTEITKVRKELLPLLAPMLGNDVISRLPMRQFYNQVINLRPTSGRLTQTHKNIFSVLRWLKDQPPNPDAVLKKVLNQIKVPNHLKDDYDEAIQSYNPKESTIEHWFTEHSENCPLVGIKNVERKANYFCYSKIPYDSYSCLPPKVEKQLRCSCLKRANSNLMFGFELPFWFVMAYRSSLIEPIVTNIWNKKFIFTVPQVECQKYESPYIKLEPLVMSIRGVLWSTLRRSNDIRKFNLPKQPGFYQSLLSSNKNVDCNQSEEEYDSYDENRDSSISVNGENNPETEITTGIPEDQIVTYNNIPEDQIVTDDNVTEDQIVTDDNVTEDQIVTDDNVTEDQIVTDNNVTEDQIVTDNNVPEDQIVTDNNVPEDQIVTDNNIPEDQIVTDNNVPEDQIVTDINVSDDKIETLVLDKVYDSRYFKTRNSNGDQSISEEDEVSSHSPPRAKKIKHNMNTKEMFADDTNELILDSCDSSSDDSLEDDDIPSSQEELKDSIPKKRKVKKSETQNCESFLRDKQIPCLKWWVRKKNDLKPINLEQINVKNYSHICPSMFEINSVSIEKKRKSFYSLTKRKIVFDEKLPADLEFMLYIICYWYLTYKKPSSYQSLLSFLVSIIMFYIVDVKFGRKRSVEHFKSIHKDAAKVETMVEQGSVPDASSLNVLELIQSLTREEINCARFSMHKYHSVDHKDNKHTHEKIRVHAFSELQSCFYFLNILNGMVSFPYPSICIQSFCSGTFCYNIHKCFINDDLNSNLISLFGYNKRVIHLYTRLYSLIAEHLPIHQFNILVQEEQLFTGNMQRFVTRNQKVLRLSNSQIGKVTKKAKKIRKKKPLPAVEVSSLEHDLIIDPTEEDLLVLANNRFSQLLFTN